MLSSNWCAVLCALRLAVLASRQGKAAVRNGIAGPGTGLRMSGRAGWRAGLADWLWWLDPGPGPGRPWLVAGRQACGLVRELLVGRHELGWPAGS